MDTDKYVGQEGQEGKCKGTNRNGKPCRAAATQSGLCFFHSNPSKATELGRIGGRKNRHGSACADDPPLLIESAKQVRDTVARLLNDVYLGKLSPRIAVGMASLLNLQLRAIEATAWEARIDRVEQWQSYISADWSNEFHSEGTESTEPENG